MTPKQELAALDLKYQIAIGRLVIYIGEAMIEGKDVSKDMFNLKAAIQVHKLFLSEYGREDFSFSTLERCLLLLESLLKLHIPNGHITVYDYEVTSPQPKILKITLTGDGTGGQPGPVDPNDYITTLKIPKSAFNEGYVYINYGLVNIDFSLIISGGIMLREDIDYTKNPSGGFSLINGVTMSDTDVIMLTAVKSFNSVPLDPEQPQEPQARYVKEDYVDEDYVE